MPIPLRFQRLPPQATKLFSYTPLQQASLYILDQKRIGDLRWPHMIWMIIYTNHTTNSFSLATRSRSRRAARHQGLDSSVPCRTVRVSVEKQVKHADRVVFIRKVDVINRGFSYAILVPIAWARLIELEVILLHMLSRCSRNSSLRPRQLRLGFWYVC